VISELEIIRMRMGRVLRLLLSDVVDFRISARLLCDVFVFVGCVMCLGAAVGISELEVVRLSVCRLLWCLLGDVVDFRIGDGWMVHAWLELEGGMILVAARRLSERERVAHNESVLR